MMLMSILKTVRNLLQKYHLSVDKFEPGTSLPFWSVFSPKRPTCDFCQ